MWTDRWSINHGFTLKRIEMLLERNNSWHNPRHRSVSSGVENVRTSHDNRGAPAFLRFEMSRDERVTVVSDALKEPGIIKSCRTQLRKDVTGDPGRTRGPRHLPSAEPQLRSGRDRQDDRITHLLSNDEHVVPLVIFLIDNLPIIKMNFWGGVKMG